MSEEALSIAASKEEKVQDSIISRELEQMFAHKSKLSNLVPRERITAYKNLYFYLRELQQKGELPVHPKNQYLGDSELAHDIYKRKYYLKDLDGSVIEQRPEDVFTRLASYIAAIESDVERQKTFAVRF